MPSTAYDIAQAYPEAAPIAEDIVALANRLGMPDPGWFANLMNFETGGTFSPSVRNKKSGATGLIQFTTDTARGMGTSTSELAQMTQKEQMEWVERYMVKRLKRGTFEHPTDVYMAVFFPAAMGKGPDFSMYDWYLRNRSQERADRFVRQNPGILTAGDYANYANSRAKLPTGLESSPTQPQIKVRDPKKWVPLVIIGASVVFMVVALMTKTTR